MEQRERNLVDSVSKFTEGQKTGRIMKMKCSTIPVGLELLYKRFPIAEKGQSLQEGLCGPRQEIWRASRREGQSVTAINFAKKFLRDAKLKRC